MTESLETTGSPPGGEPSRETRERLLDAAEHLFAERGIDGASLRTITREAGANLASVHYHFGSKDGLVRAVFARRLRPLNRQRLEALDRLEAAGEPVALEALIRAFVEPVLLFGRQLDHLTSDGAGVHDFARLLSRAFDEPEERTREALFAELREVKDRFQAALATALPGLAEEELHWRFHFMIGAMAHTASAGHLAEYYSHGLCDAADVETTTDRLVGFLAAGFASPPPECRAEEAT